MTDLTSEQAREVERISNEIANRTCEIFMDNPCSCMPYDAITCRKVRSAIREAVKPKLAELEQMRQDAETAVRIVNQATNENAELRRDNEILSGIVGSHRVRIIETEAREKALREALGDVVNTWRSKGLIDTEQAIQRAKIVLAQYELEQGQE